MQQSSPAPLVVQQQLRGQAGGAPATLAEMSAFFEEQLRIQREHDDKARDEIKAQRQEMEAKVEHAMAKMDEMRDEAVESRVRDAQLRGQQLPALQARLEALHQAKLLADEELYAVEDAIADSETGTDDDRVPTLIALSLKMASDRAFARQLQRKKWL